MKVLYSKKNGIANKLSGVNLPVDADKINYDNTESELQSTNVQDAIDEIVTNKVDKVTGKGLSTNDYDNTEKEQNTANASAIEAIVNVYGGKNLLDIDKCTLADITMSKNGNTITFTNPSSTYYPRAELSLLSAKENGITQIRFTTNANGSNTDSCIALLNGYTNIKTINAYGQVTINEVFDISGYNDPKLIFYVGGISDAVPLNCTLTITDPMLRDARISDPTYVPYTKTNKELTIETNNIDPMLNFYGSKNLYNLNGYSLINGFAISNNVVSNAITDNYSTWMFYLYAIDAAGSSTRLYYEPISTTGLKEIPITVPNGIKYFRIFHSGGTTNFYLDIPFTEAGNFIFSMNILGHNSTIVGGLSFTDVMIRDPQISDNTYAPYAMTNRELTEKKISKVKYTISGNTSLDVYTGIVNVDPPILICIYRDSDVYASMYYAFTKYNTTPIIIPIIASNRDYVTVDEIGSRIVRITNLTQYDVYVDIVTL